MGRPKGSKNKPTSAIESIAIERRSPAKKELIRKQCALCGKEMAISNFYKIPKSEYVMDGLSPYCKECTKKSCMDENGVADIEKLKTMLRMMNRPFIENVWLASVVENDNDWRLQPEERGKRGIGTIAKYFKSINSLPQYVSLDWEQGVQFNLIRNAAQSNATPPSLDKLQKKFDSEKPVILEEDEENDFVVTKDIVKKFGSGYTKVEYQAMVDKYDFLSQSYPELTNLHTESLITYIRYKVKEELATAAGNVDKAEKWASLAAKAADKAKINPSQLSQSDLQGGLNSFSELLMAVEQAEDIIPILPQFKFRPNDAVDFTIWCYVNYIRRCEGKPQCSYEDIWRFYDERKREYIEQYGDPTGIFDNDPTEKNRKNVERFITLPKDYNGDSNG